MEHTKHLWRAGAIAVFLTLAALLVRHLLVPESFGVDGFYRYDSLGEFMSKPVIHGGQASCEPCHSEQFETKMAGSHASVTCEVCHGPLARHVAEGAKTADMPVIRSHRLCAWCHQELVARPADMPQVDIVEHLRDFEMIPEDGALPEGICAECHDVHDPGLG